MALKWTTSDARQKRKDARHWQTNEGKYSGIDGGAKQRCAEVNDSINSL